jgi:erythromycin esterase-like protein
MTGNGQDDADDRRELSEYDAERRAKWAAALARKGLHARKAQVVAHRNREASHLVTPNQQARHQRRMAEKLGHEVTDALEASAPPERVVEAADMKLEYVARRMRRRSGRPARKRASGPPGGAQGDTGSSPDESTGGDSGDDTGRFGAA